MRKQKVKYKNFESDFIIWIRKRYGIEINKKNINKSPAEFGLDSLDIIEMQLWVEEKYHIQLNPAEYSEHRPISEFLSISFIKITGK